MIYYVVYDSVTGEIKSTGAAEASLPDLQASLAPDGVVEGIGSALTDYVYGGVLLPRPSLSATISKSVIQADGFDTATIAGVPSGWDYEISNGDSGLTTGGDIEVAALEPGEYTIRFSNWPYQDVEYTITATSYPVGTPTSPVGTPWRLHSNPSVTVEELKTAGYAEMHELDDEFLYRELAFLGSTRVTFLLKATEAKAYADAGYPTPFDSSAYPMLGVYVEVCGCTAQEAADAILADKAKYDELVKHTERARMSAYNQISLAGLLETVAREIFDWRHSFGLPATMEYSLNKSFVSPQPDPPYETVEVAGDGVDALEITLPEKSRGDDLEVIVEAFAPPGDPWRGAYYQAYTNPTSPLSLTFTDPTDPLYASSDIKWLITIRNMPRVPAHFVVDSTTA